MSYNDNMNVRLTTETTVTKYAEVTVNGQSKGKRVINGTPSLSQFATDVAREFGIKAFTITVDDSVVSTSEQAKAPIQEGSRVAVAAKETRGGIRTEAEMPETNQQSEPSADEKEEQQDEEEDAA